MGPSAIHVAGLMKKLMRQGHQIKDIQSIGGRDFETRDDGRREQSVFRFYILFWRAFTGRFVAASEPRRERDADVDALGGEGPVGEDGRR